MPDVYKRQFPRNRLKLALVVFLQGVGKTVLGIDKGRIAIAAVSYTHLVVPSELHLEIGLVVSDVDILPRPVFGAHAALL